MNDSNLPPDDFDWHQTELTRHWVADEEAQNKAELRRFALVKQVDDSTRTFDNSIRIPFFKTYFFGLWLRPFVAGWDDQIRKVEVFEFPPDCPDFDDSARDHLSPKD